MQTHFTMLLFAAGKVFLGKWTIIIWGTSRSRKNLSSFSHNWDLINPCGRRRGIAIVPLIYLTAIVSKMHTHTKIPEYVHIQNCIPVEWGRMEIGYKLPHLLSFSNSQNILRTSNFIVVVLMISVQVHHASQQSFALRVLNKIRNTLDWFSAPPLYSLCPNGFW